MTMGSLSDFHGSRLRTSGSPLTRYVSRSRSSAAAITLNASSGNVAARVKRQTTLLPESGLPFGPTDSRVLLASTVTLPTVIPPVWAHCVTPATRRHTLLSVVIHIFARLMLVGSPRALNPG